MTTDQVVKINLGFVDDSSDDEQKDLIARRFCQQIRELEEVESVYLVKELYPPDRSKTGAGIIPGWLTAEISFKNIAHFFGFLSNRLSNQVIELEVEANGKKLKVKVSSKEELQHALQVAKEFTSTGES